MNTTIFKTSLLSASCVLLLAGSALALPVAGQYVKIDTTGLGNANGGGEFYLDIGTTASTGFDGIADYTSFCLEISEHISYADGFNNSPIYYINSVQNEVVGGGGSNPDPLDTVTKWTYWKYIHTNYFQSAKDVNNANYNLNNLANYIQEIIWFSENEVSSLSNSTTKTDGGAQFLYDHYIYTQYNDQYNPYVTALNINWVNCDGSIGANAQSQLVSAPVPEPTVTMLFALGAVGFAGMARRRMNR